LTLIQQTLGDAALSNLRPREAIPFHLRATAVQQALVDLDPGNKIAQNNLGSAQMALAECYWALGEVDDALDTLDASVASMRIAGEGGAGLRLAQMQFLSQAAMRNVDAGRLAKARDLAGELGENASSLQASEPAGSPLPIFADSMKVRADALTAYGAGDVGKARSLVAEVLARLHSLKMQSDLEKRRLSGNLFMLNELQARFELALRNHPAAEQSARASLAAKESFPIDPPTDARIEGQLSTLIALSLAEQERPAEALKVIGPVVKLQRELANRNHGDEGQKVQMASALYVQALADPARRTPLLAEARALLGGLPGPMKSLKSTRIWDDRVREAMR
jgi:tetratricopeptide (TPR) repeat protein